MFKDLITRHKNLTGLVIAVVILCFVPLFVDSPYYLDLMIITIMYAILAMTFVMMLRTGLINLGIAAFWGIGAYISTILVMKLGLSFWLSLPLSTLITAAIALMLGYVLLGKAGSGFTFVMLTSVIGMLFNVVVGNIPYVGGYSGITNIPRPDAIVLPFMTIDFSSKAHFFYLALFMLVVAILVASAFYSSWAGRAWKAIGLNPRLAESIGVNIFRYKLLVFVLGSALAGFAGSFYAHYEGFITPSSYQMWVNIYIHIYGILGGIGYPIWGPLVGSAILIPLDEWTNAVFTGNLAAVSRLIYGGMLVALILWQPRGLLYWFGQLARRFRSDESQMGAPERRVA